MFEQIEHYFFLYLEYGFFLGLFLLLNLYIYDRFIQRRHQLLINYPVIGRMRYLFEKLRDPMRQYFGEETFYESRDKADAVAIARGFMMSGGCIRARVCNGAGGHICLVGLATQDPRRRTSYLVVHKSHEIANYIKILSKASVQ